MGLSRKRKKELKQLKREANKLWGAQQDLLNHANSVARDASRQIGNFGRETVVPAARGAYSDTLAPVVDRGVSVGRDAAGVVKKGVDTKVIPALGGVIGSVLSIGDVAKDKRVQAAVKRLHLEKYAPKKSGPGAGTVIAIGLGVLAAAGVAYAAWQTFRADDELWVADDEPILPNA